LPSLLARLMVQLGVGYFANVLARRFGSFIKHLLCYFA
jgi:hypothetical protein